MATKHGDQPSQVKEVARATRNLQRTHCTPAGVKTPLQPLPVPQGPHLALAKGRPRLSPAGEQSQVAQGHWLKGENRGTTVHGSLPSCEAAQGADGSTSTSNLDFLSLFATGWIY